MAGLQVYKLLELVVKDIYTIRTVNISAAVPVAPNEKFLVILVAAMGERQPAATEHQF